ncbi:MAG: hypothetical protein A3F78_04700 [Burkholderiales bacterium RIFCSPLOWO2_12_FULL_61_40]|nr:MAG: hypothetical protein A3F78_04700 [Burkholderiales bacterium RIFCSPLOWO2_12_FULL_61_40]
MLSLPWQQSRLRIAGRLGTWRSTDAEKQQELDNNALAFAGEGGAVAVAARARRQQSLWRGIAFGRATARRRQCRLRHPRHHETDGAPVQSDTDEVHQAAGAEEDA